MATMRRGLGRGLDALFSDQPVTESKLTSPAEKVALNSGEVLIKTSLIVPNPNQPRKTFDDVALSELTASIREYGVLTPLLVKKNGETYEIIAGERRWRAAQAAGVKELPVVIRDYDDQKTAEIAIIENLQRENLNAIEEAMAYQQLIDDYELSQEEVALRVSKNRSTITNALRLLKLTPEVRSMVIAGELTGGHARTLLSIENPELQKSIAKKVVETKMSVRELEKQVKSATRKKKEKTEKETPQRDLGIFYKEYEDRLEEKYGTKVRINRKDNSKGRIEIEYYTSADLERILETLL